MRFDCRSALYMPASNARAVAKGPSLSADAIVLDLEDSVSEDKKTEARRAAAQAITSLDYGYRLRVLRINALDSHYYLNDIKAAAECQPDALVLPKVDSVQDIETACSAMDAYSALANTAIWAMMESPLAVINANDIAKSSTRWQRLNALLIGNNDMAKQSNMPVQSDRTYLVPWLMSLVVAAKAYQLGILDGVYNDHADLDGFTRECAQAVTMGMDGKTVIHPAQLSACNAAFSPSSADLAHARAVVTAFADPQSVQKGVLSIDGKMIERLHLQMAEELLQRSERLALRT